MRLPMTILASAFLVGACAGSGESRYAAEEDRLRAACETRGGVFTPLPRTHTGNPGADNACRLYTATRVGR